MLYNVFKGSGWYRCPVTRPESKMSKQVTLYAKSINFGAYVRFGRMAFNAATQEDADVINALPPHKDWLYYPEETATALAGHGVSSIIHCHSGRILETMA